MALVGLVMEQAVAAQSRPPIERISTSAYQVRDIAPGSDRRSSSMGTPARLGNYLIAWILTNPNSCYLYLWRIDPATGRSTLLKEISPIYDPSFVPFVHQAGRLYFAARAPDEPDFHLWSTDGTPEGTEQARGPGGLGFDFPAALTSFGGYLYFFAGTSGDSSNTRLWRTDGTLEGTTQVGDVRGLPSECIGFEGGGGCGATEPPITVVGGRMLVVGLSPRYPNPAYALFSSNGERTDFLMEFQYGWPYVIEKLGEIAYFEVQESYQVHGSQLWRTDGRREGTWMVKDFCPGGCSSGISYIKAVGQSLLFFGWDGTHHSLWKSDGTQAGTARLADIGGENAEFRSVGGLAFFVGYDPEHGSEIWRTDGTPNGTRLVKDVHPGAEWSFIGGLTAAGPFAFFIADDGVHGPALWRTDGTDAGTIMLRAIPPIAGSPPGPLVAFGNSVYFAAEDPTHGRELWSSDGTLAGTRLVVDVYPGNESSQPFVIPAPELRLQFLARGPEGMSLWDTDGSAVGTRRIARIDSGAENRSSNPSLLNDVEGQLFFFTGGTCSCSLSNLWVSDGTEEGTVPLGTIHPGSSAISAGGSLYFNDSTSSGATVSSQLYRIDGRSRVMTKLADTNADNFTAVGDTLYFTLKGALWRADQGRDEIVPIKNFYAYRMVSSGGALYVQTGSSDPGIWKSDGTEAGTVRIHSGSVSHLTDAEGVLYYVSLYEPGGVSLRSISPWLTGTTLVRRFSTASVTEDPFSATTGAGGLLFFLLRDGYQYQLWRSDGTDLGTYRVSEVAASGPLVSDGTGVYFIGFDRVHGSELWHSSGTPEGTARVRDIHAGPGSSSPAELKIVGGVLLFSADDGVHGRELWRSDSTEEGTHLLEDICPGACSSRPAGFTVSGGNVFFSANDGETGNELWEMPLSAIDLPRKSPTLPWRH